MMRPYKGIYQKHDRFVKNHVFLRGFLRPIASKREFWLANPSETRLLDAQVRENHAFYDVFSRPDRGKPRVLRCFPEFPALKKMRAFEGFKKNTTASQKTILFYVFFPGQSR